MLKWVAFGFVALVLGVLGLAGGAYLAVRTASPSVPLDAEVTEDDALLLRGILGRVQASGEPGAEGKQKLRLSQAEIEAAARLVTSRLESIGVRVRAQADGLRITASAVSPFPRWTPYVDAELTVQGPPRSVQVADARLGALPIPRSIAQMGVDESLRRLRARSSAAGDLLDRIESVRHAEEALVVVVRASDLRPERFVRELVTERVGRARLQAFARALSEAFARVPPGRAVPLAAVLRTLFQTVETRADPDLEAEIRAALLVSTLHVVGVSPRRALGIELADIPRRRVLIWKRSDLPKHFLVSAVVAAWEDRALADVLGLSKELTDSEAGGSGFSFVDLAADRAGTQLVERAWSTSERRERLVDLLSEPSLTNADLLPDPTDFPEGMSKERLEATNRRPASPGYVALVDAMDRRLEASPLHRALMTP